MRNMAEALKGKVKLYMFVSSTSFYGDSVEEREGAFAAAGVPTAPVLEQVLAENGMTEGLPRAVVEPGSDGSYGSRKARCEDQLVSKNEKFVSKARNFALKTRSFAFQNDEFCSGASFLVRRSSSVLVILSARMILTTGGLGGSGRLHKGGRTVLAQGQVRNIRLKMMNLLVTHDELFVQNDGFWSRGCNGLTYGISLSSPWRVIYK